MILSSVVYLKLDTKVDWQTIDSIQSFAFPLHNVLNKIKYPRSMSIKAVPYNHIHQYAGVDRFFLFFSPFLFILFNVGYWGYFLTWDTWNKKDGEWVSRYGIETWCVKYANFVKDAVSLYQLSYQLVEQLL